MALYQKKTEIIDAIIFDGEEEKVIQWVLKMDDKYSFIMTKDKERLVVTNKSNSIIAKRGDILVRNQHGVYSVWPNDLFLKIFTKIN